MFTLYLFLCVFTLAAGQNIHDRKDLVGSIEHLHRVNDRAKKYLESSNAPSVLQQRRADLGGIDDVRARAEVALEALAENENDVSSMCLNHTKIFLGALANGGETWALRMIDAMGKPPSGLLDFHLVWPGSWDECWAVEATVNRSSVISHPFTGKYCLTTFVLGEAPQSGGTPFRQQQYLTLTLGVCYPSSCSPQDATVLVQILEELLPINTTGLPPPILTCNELNPTYSGKAKAILVICSLFLVVVALATAYDILFLNWWCTRRAEELPTKKTYGSFNGYTGNGHIGNGHVANDKTPLIGDDHLENGGPTHSDTKHSSVEMQNNLQQDKSSYKPGLGGKLLLSFSVYTNAPKIFNTKQPAGTLTAVNGIRFISMTWVILGHTYAFGLQIIDNITTYLPEVESRLSFQAISNATFAVDTFFVLSGLLVSYLSLKEMKKRGGMKNFKWGMYYFHRFWRLTPPYMLFLMTYVPLAKYLANGPMYPQSTGFDVDECRDTWWTNLLYVNNLVKPDKMCMGWSWYLANDMQFYVLSPLMLIPLYYSPLWGTVSCLALVLVNFLSAGITSKHYEFGANMLLGGGFGNSFTKLYIPPWTRIGPYAVGFFTGYLLYKTDCKVKMSKIVNAIGWLVATALAVLILYGLWSSDNKETLSVDMSALYNATSRTMWGVAIAWVVFACATGYGGPVNSLLSWSAVIPFSRLTYCAYLVHPVIMYTYYYSHRTLVHWYDLEVAYIFLANLCLSYAGAFILSLVYESPMMGLEKVLLGREKNS